MVWKAIGIYPLVSIVVRLCVIWLLICFVNRQIFLSMLKVIGILILQNPSNPLTHECHFAHMDYWHDICFLLSTRMISSFYLYSMSGLTNLPRVIALTILLVDRGRKFDGKTGRN